MDILHNCALGIRKQFKLWEILENFMKSMQTENFNEPVEINRLKMPLKILKIMEIWQKFTIFDQLEAW